MNSPFQRAAEFMQRGEFQKAEEILIKLIAHQPLNFDAIHMLGIVSSELGRTELAERYFSLAYSIDPKYPPLYQNWGLFLSKQKRFEEAIDKFSIAIQLAPNFPPVYSDRGNALTKLERYSEAINDHNQAIKLAPDFFAFYNNRGNTFKEQNEHTAALADYDRAIQVNPNYADAFNGRANIFTDLKLYDEALAAFDKAIALKPDLAEAWLGRGNVYADLKRFDEAFAAYDRALALKPDLPHAWVGRGNIFARLKHYDEAFANYDRAIALKPDFAEAFCNRGGAFRDDGRWAEAVVDCEQAAALRPNYAEAKFALCIAQLPVLYGEEREIAERRVAYQERLEALDVDQQRMACDWVKAVGSSQPFYLAYQGYNDHDLQSVYGSLVCRIMAERYPTAALSPPPQSDEPIRLGIVSGFFREHSNWKVPIKGWLRQIDRHQFQIFGYHTGVEKDAETKQAVALCDRFVQGPLSTDRWREVILADGPHVLIYPEVGMDPVSVQLAAQRLAPVQCNSWGHPDTSGFPTLDYYLSSELMEPPDAQDHYTESLVCLPNLSIYYEPLDQQPAVLNRADLGLRSSAMIYWCGQSLYKYLPQFDEVFPRIARGVGDCQFVFIRYAKGAHVTELFRKRLERAFAAFGLRASDYCVVLPELDTHKFLGAIGQCDVVLDSIGWSGCNSTLEGLTHDLPIVTMTSSLMRGRHSMAILKMMGIEETITETIDDYVSVAVRLARDTAWRRATKTKIAEAKHRVYRDTNCIIALQDFLVGVVRQPTRK